jgi:peptidoglycan hydrolase CwlO-like protein
MDLAGTIEAWTYANIELDRIDADLESNGRHLVAAKKSLVVAQKRIQKRLRDLYVNGSGDSTLEVLLGARSLDDVIARLDAIERVSSQDTRVLAAVKKYRKEVATRRASLESAREDQASIVAERAAQKSSIESRLAEREQMLASVKDEISQLQAEERARRQAAAEARARAQAQALELQQATESYVDPSPRRPTSPTFPRRVTARS